MKKSPLQSRQLIQDVWLNLWNKIAKLQGMLRLRREYLAANFYRFVGFGIHFILREIFVANCFFLFCEIGQIKSYRTSQVRLSASHPCVMRSDERDRSALDGASWWTDRSWWINETIWIIQAFFQWFDIVLDLSNILQNLGGPGDPISVSQSAQVSVSFSPDFCRCFTPCSIPYLDLNIILCTFLPNNTMNFVRLGPKNLWTEHFLSLVQKIKCQNLYSRTLFCPKMLYVLKNESNHMLTRPNIVKEVFMYHSDWNGWEKGMWAKQNRKNDVGHLQMPHSLYDSPCNLRANKLHAIGFLCSRANFTK